MKGNGAVIIPTYTQPESYGAFKEGRNGGFFWFSGSESVRAKEKRSGAQR